MAVYLGQIGSIIFMFVAHNLSHSIKVAFLEGPYSSMNSTNVSTLIPRLRIPLTVGNLGSSQPSTTFVSTSAYNLRLDMHVFTRLNLENSYISTGLSSNVFCTLKIYIQIIITISIIQFYQHIHWFSRHELRPQYYPVWGIQNHKLGKHDI